MGGSRYYRTLRVILRVSIAIGILARVAGLQVAYWSGKLEPAGWMTYAARLFWPLAATEMAGWFLAGMSGALMLLQRRHEPPMTETPS